MGGAGKAPLKFDPKPSEAAFLAVLRTLIKCQSDVAGDVISGVAVDQVSLVQLWRVWVRQWPNYLTLGLAGPVFCITLVHCLNVFCSRPEATSVIMFGRFVGLSCPRQPCEIW